jgi:hypothetical protein
VIVMGLGWVGEAQAGAVSGGSRLLFYFTKRSFASGAGDNTAFTLLFITNSNTNTASRIGVKYYKGSDCTQTVGPVFQNIAAGETIQLNVAEQAPAFQEGVAEAFFVNGAGQPIRNDFGIGQSVIVDQSLVAVLKLPAASLYSDNRGTGQGSATIADNTAPISFAPFLLTGQFLPPSITTSRLALFSPGTVPGTASADTLATVDFRQPNGTDAGQGPLNTACGRNLTLAQVRGVDTATFEATFPGGGIVVPVIGGSQEKGVLGWVIETIQLPGVNILMGALLPASITADLGAHP